MKKYIFSNIFAQCSGDGGYCCKAVPCLLRSGDYGDCWGLWVIPNFPITPYPPYLPHPLYLPNSPSYSSSPSIPINPIIF